MIRLTAKAALTNFYVGYYMALFLLGVSTITGLLLNGDLLMSSSIVAAGAFGLFAGTTLAEIKVKPLSYTLPRQERSMAPALLLVGTVVCAAYAILVLMRPLSFVDIPTPQQSLSVFGFSLGLFMLLATVCVVTRDTAFLPLVVIIPLALLLSAVSNDTLSAPWLALNAAIVERPLLSLLFAALGVGLVFSVLGSRELSRRLCGAPFLPPKAYDNPFRTEDYRSRMRSAAFRPSVMTDSRGLPGGAFLAALNRRLAGTSWDYLVLDTRISRNSWELAFRLVYFVTFLVWLVVWSPLFDRAGSLSALLFLAAWTFMFFPPTFKPRLSPMLPVGRGRHFRSFIAKGILVYAFTLAGMLLLRVLARVFPTMASQVSGALAAIVDLPFEGMLMAAAAIPILCWASAKLRSTIGLIVFMVLFLAIVVNVAARAYDPLMRLGYPAVLLVSALCWLPFTYIAWKRCHRDDLLLP